MGTVLRYTPYLAGRVDVRARGPSEPLGRPGSGGAWQHVSAPTEIIKTQVVFQHRPKGQCCKTFRGQALCGRKDMSLPAPHEWSYVCCQVSTNGLNIMPQGLEALHTVNSP